MVQIVLLGSLLLSAACVNSAVLNDRAAKPYINNTLEHGVVTECKTCPYSLCPNVAAYDYDSSMKLTCWTHGDVISRGGNDGNNVWLKTDKNCYVTQYDLLLYNGTYETDLAYCGKASEVKKYTQTPAKAKYNTECWICPSISCDNVAYHKYGTNLVTTCYADEDPESAPYNGDSVWVKTTQNCYVSETGLVTKPDRSKLDNCGPIPFLQLNQTTKGTPQTSEPDEKRAPPNLDLDKRYLVDFLVGEDFAVCYKNYTTAAPVVKKYKWDTKVAAQCFEDENSYPETLVGYWLLTTDFCWVRGQDFWEGSGRGNYRFPRCSLFV